VSPQLGCGNEHLFAKINAGLTRPGGSGIESLVDFCDSAQCGKGWQVE